MFDKVVKKLATGNFVIDCTVGDIKEVISEMMNNRDKVKEELLKDHDNIHKIEIMILGLKDEGIGSDKFYEAMNLWVMIVLKEMWDEAEGDEMTDVIELTNCWINTTGEITQTEN